MINLSEVIADSIIEKIELVFNKTDYNIEKKYHGQSIEVTSKAENVDTHLWIRVENIEHKRIVNISSVAINESNKRKGIFTKLVKCILLSNKIDAVKISSVCTDEMRNWCKKNELTALNDFDYIINKT